MTFIINLIIGLFVSIFILFICFYSYIKIRQRFPKQQICWFCHKSQKVSYNRINSFDCIYCQQYNGFLEDGSYNKVMRSQFETKNDLKYCQPIPNCYSNCVQLCGQCNVRQEIKIKLLSEFLPFNELNFTQECDEYKKYLENEYKLCPLCETKLKTVLTQPINTIKDVVQNNCQQKVSPNDDSVFVGHSIQRNVNWLSFSLMNMFEIISLFCGLIVFVLGLDELQKETDLSVIEFPKNSIQYIESYVSNQTLVVFSGFMASITAVMICGKQSLLMTNLFSQFLWIALISLETSLMKTYIEKIDSILLRPVLSLFVVFFSIINTSLRLFAFFDTKSKIKQKSNKTIEQNNSHKKPMNSKINACFEAKPAKNICKTNNKPIERSHQSIGDQIKCLSIFDETDSTLNYRQPQNYLRAQNNIFSNNNLLNTSLMSETSSGKSIILPAKFHYQSVTQTSWASPFKPNTSPRKENLNFSSYMTSSQSLARTSQWVSHHISGLVTPPPSATTSVCSDSTFVNRFATTDGNNFMSYESRGKDLYNNSNNHLIKSRFISQQFFSGDSLSRDSNSDSVGINGSLTSNNKIKTSNDCLKHQTYAKQSLFVTVTQNCAFALFILILFCFVTFLSLPIVLKTSFDLNSMNFHLTVESMPQNDVCIQ